MQVGTYVLPKSYNLELESTWEHRIKVGKANCVTRAI